MDHVRDAIIRTLAFNAAWGYAPTRLQLAMNLDVGSVDGEMQKFTPLQFGLPIVWIELDRLIQEGTVVERQAHVALAFYAEQIEQGRTKEFYFPRKLRRARQVTAYLSRLPWVHAVCLCNTTALGQARNQSDLDFFIVAKAGAIWRTRFFATLPFKLLGARPSTNPSSPPLNIRGGEEGLGRVPPSSVIARSSTTWQSTVDRHASSDSARDDRDGQEILKEKSKIADPICLSFFVTDDALDLSRFMLADDDPYFRYWFLSLLPLYEDGVLGDLWDQNLKVRARHPLARPWMSLDGDDLPGVSKKDPTVSSWLENRLKTLQQKNFPASIKSLANRDTRVVIDDQALKFHVEDQRAAYRDKHYVICRQYGVEP